VLQNWLQICESKGACEEHHFTDLIAQAAPACLPMISAVERDMVVGSELVCACLLPILSNIYFV